MSVQRLASTSKNFARLKTSPAEKHLPAFISLYPQPCLSSKFSIHGERQFKNLTILRGRRLPRNEFVVRSSSDSSVRKWLPASDVSISDVLWPSAGAFVAMAVLGRMDQVVAAKGISFTIAPLGAVCAVLFCTPSAPSAKKFNMFVAQIACAAFGVLAFSLFGPGWLARGASLSASIAFMIATGTTHPPAASLPLLFIDGAKFHKLQFWYAFFPGAVGCLLLCLIQEAVVYAKNNFKF
ncbi:hypothetical protein LUZ60_005276 [Juncus effusus]|nr:hypothetical protein LUZ60_005276 [Juncus effusus]